MKSFKEIIRFRNNETGILIQISRPLLDMIPAKALGQRKTGGVSFHPLLVLPNQIGMVECNCTSQFIEILLYAPIDMHAFLMFKVEWLIATARIVFSSGILKRG